jgi:hypothetical protein
MAPDSEILLRARPATCRPVLDVALIEPLEVFIQPLVGCSDAPVSERGHSNFMSLQSKAWLLNHIFEESDMSGPNVADIIEKPKQLCRLDGMLWSSLDFQNPMAVQSRTAWMAGDADGRKYLERAQTLLETTQTRHR